MVRHRVDVLTFDKGTVRGHSGRGQVPQGGQRGSTYPLSYVPGYPPTGTGQGSPEPREGRQSSRVESSLSCSQLAADHHEGPSHRPLFLGCSVEVETADRRGRRASWRGTRCTAGAAMDGIGGTVISSRTGVKSRAVRVPPARGPACSVAAHAIISPSTTISSSKTTTTSSRRGLRQGIQSCVTAALTSTSKGTIKYRHHFPTTSTHRSGRVARDMRQPPSLGTRLLGSQQMGQKTIKSQK